MAAKPKSNKKRQTPDKKKGLVGYSRGEMSALRARFRRPEADDTPLPNALKLNLWQRRALIIAVVISLVAGFLLIRGFITVIAVSALLAVIFHPVYARLNRRLQRPGTAAMLTLVIALLAIIIPFTIIIVLTVGQLQQLLHQLTQFGGNFSLSDAGNKLLDEINKLLASVTGGSYQISAGQLQQGLVKLTADLANFFLGLLTSSFSSVANLITQFILFIYIFTAMLAHGGSLLKMFRDLNPLGEDISSLYLSRANGMVKGTIKGQFVIAFCQGLAGATFLYITGIHYFFFFALVLTFLSVIPLGGGIIIIPIGIIMLLTGNVWQGLFLLMTHFFITTNIDNVLRPRLVPRSVRMNSALMMLAVFGGIGLFGFLGIVVGPVIMILVVSTLRIYLPLAEARKKVAQKTSKLAAKSGA